MTTDSSSIDQIPAAKLISVIVSFRNEEDNIPHLVRRLTAVFDKEPERLEIIFVNDDSSDRSLEVLRNLNAADNRIKIVNMARRFGVSECVLAGMETARGDAVIYLDCDLQDPPELIPKMLHEWRNGSQVVHTLREQRLGESPTKMFLTRMAYRAIQLGSNIKLPVDCGDFKLLDRLVVERLITLPENDPYLRGLVIWIGYKQTFVPYIREARHSGTTHFPLFSRNPWRTVIGGITSFSNMPIYVFGMVGVAGALLSLGLLLGSLLGYVFTNMAGFGTAFLIGLGLLLWSILVLAISTVGLYVVRIYKDVRGRPRYIIKDTEGFGPAD